MKRVHYSSNHANHRSFANAILRSVAIGTLLAAASVISGCGGYHTGGSMPGQTPRTYPMTHETSTTLRSSTAGATTMARH